MSAVSDDAAWVIVETSLSPEALSVFCEYLERLYRINPCLEFHSWQRFAPDRYSAAVTNLSNGRHVVQGMALECLSHGFRVVYSAGIKRSTTFEIRPAPTGSSLTITDDYSSDEKPLAGREEEVDRSLWAWGVALRAYFKTDRRWGWIPGWNAYRSRVWLTMKPSARRITGLIVLVTIAEFAFFLLVVSIYWLEQQH